MTSGQAPIDDNNRPALAGYDATGHQIVAAEIVSVTTDSTTGIKHGPLNVNASFSASSLSINDPNTTTQKAGVNAGGSLQVAGQGTAGTPAGGIVSIQGVAGGTAIPVSGSISATNPSVGTDGNAIPTSSTLIGASDGTNLQQLLVESASQRNLRTGIYSGANEATVTGANALKVDGSAVTQPVNGTVTANAGTGNFNNAAIGATEVAIPTSAMLIGASDGTNLEELLIESNANPNLRVGVYNGANEMAVAAGGQITSVMQSVAGTALVADQSNSELRTSIYGKNATAGDTAIATDASGRIQTTNYISGSAVSVTNPYPSADQIRLWIAAGQGFSATTGKQTSGSPIQTGMALVNPANSGKNVLIYSVRCGNATAGVDTLYLYTSDPAISGITVTAANCKPGGASSVVTLEAQNTSVTATGTLFDAIYDQANGYVELMTAGNCILLPSTSTINAVLLSITTSTSAWFAAFKWIEY